MPEGPSIVIIKEKISYLKNKTVSEATGYADIDMEGFSGRKVTDIRSWGKHLLICFSDFTLRIHFGLFGSFQLNEPKKVNPKIALHFPNDTVYFYVCTVKIIREPLDEVYDWSADVMGDQWTAARTLKRLSEHQDEQIADVLLNQEVFSGVGNIIKNEVLYRAGVHPESILKKIPKAKLEVIVEESRIYSFDFLRWREKNELSRHFEVYKQKKTRSTGSAVKFKDTGKSRRGSYFSEKEQKQYRTKD